MHKKVYTCKEASRHKLIIDTLPGEISQGQGLSAAKPVVFPGGAICDVW